jgi:O-antigen ligase
MHRLEPVLRQVQYGAVVAFAVCLPIGKSPTEAALIIGLLALVARTILHQRPLIPNNPLNRWLLAWLLVAICSMVNTVDVWASLNGLRKLAKWMGLYLLVLDTVDSRQRLQGVLAGWFLGLFLVVVDGLWQQAFSRDLFYGAPPTYQLEVVKRIAATFDHPASLGIYLVSVCPVVLALALRGAPRWRWPLIGLFLLATAVLLLAKVRGGFLAFAVSVPLLGYWLRHWVPPSLTALAAAIQLLTVPPAVKAWSASMPTIFHQLTEPGRLMYWSVALEMINDHPIIGVGVNSFVKAYPKYEQAFGQFPDIGPYAHNQYLHLMAECGLLGFVVFLGVLVVVFSALARLLSRRIAAPFEAVVGAGLGAALVAYLINGTLESSLFYSRGSLIFWLLIGLLMAVDAITRRSSPRAWHGVR